MGSITKWLDCEAVACCTCIVVTSVNSAREVASADRRRCPKIGESVCGGALVPCVGAYDNPRITFELPARRSCDARSSHIFHLFSTR
jgi:hypothetical protein